MTGSMANITSQLRAALDTMFLAVLSADLTHDNDTQAGKLKMIASKPHFSNLCGKIVADVTEERMLVQELMTMDIAQVTSETPIRKIAALMRLRDIGVVPVCENGRVIGVVTDRDIVTQLLPDDVSIAGKQAGDVMTSKVVTCRGDQPISEITAIMGDHQIRRLPVTNHENVLVGMVTIGDIARDFSEHMAGEALGEIVEER